MKILFVIAFLPFVLSTVYNGLSKTKCDPFDPPVKRNFGIEKLNGRWFNGKVTVPKAIPTLLLRSNYNYDFISGGIAVINGRLDRIDENLCIYETLQFKELPNQRSLTYTSNWKWFGKRIDLRILDTDYKTYAVFWTCTQQIQGNCTDYFAVIASKDVNGLSQGQLLSLEETLKTTLCMSVADFVDWPHKPKTVCPRKDIFNVKIVNMPPTADNYGR